MIFGMARSRFRGLGRLLAAFVCLTYYNIPLTESQY